MAIRGIDGEIDMPEGGTVLLSADQVQAAVGRLALSVARWLEIRGANRLHMVVVLEGAQRCADDLSALLMAKRVGLELVLHGIRVGATRGKTLLDTRVPDPETPIPPIPVGECVLILDDLLDSGKTLEVLRGRISSPGDQLKTAVLIHKFKDAPLRADFCGYDLNLDRGELTRQGLSDRWLFGYGMDLEGDCRDLDIVGSMEIPAFSQ